MTDDPAPTLRLRVVFDGHGMIGPGKADLLQGIAETGSISAAGRRMKMSYKRAWSLVETLNAMFAGPLVLSARGGAQGGGAALTPLGERVLAEYREIERKAREATDANRAAIAAMLTADEADMSGKT